MRRNSAPNSHGAASRRKGPPVGRPFKFRVTRYFDSLRRCRSEAPRQVFRTRVRGRLRWCTHQSVGLLQPQCGNTGPSHTCGRRFVKQSINRHGMLGNRSTDRVSASSFEMRRLIPARATRAFRLQTRKISLTHISTCGRLASHNLR